MRTTAAVMEQADGPLTHRTIKLEAVELEDPLRREGRFPLERLVRRYRFENVDQAIDDSDGGMAAEPILMMT